MVLLDTLTGGFVVIMGLGTVFVGLISIIILISIMGLIIRRFAKEEAPVKAAEAAGQGGGMVSDIPHRAEFVAAVSAAIAEELGTDISKLRIESIKKL